MRELDMLCSRGWFCQCFFCFVFLPV
uniref:Uncharacterized protein n=1 Tax=Anguilla anguilla TaxID=7936 RepID=A0A0E9Q1D9_ANGAN